MDWANEDYVRVYTRDTADLMAIGPEGRAVWWEMLRKADKSGLIDHGGDMDTMPELLRVPHEWWAKAIPKILKRGMAHDTGSALVIPNHEPAQTTPKSDKQRQKEVRQRRRGSAIDEFTKKRDGAESQNVTPESRTVTRRHAHSDSEEVTKRDGIESQNVTVNSALDSDSSLPRSSTTTSDELHQNGEEVTKRDGTESQNVTPESRTVTRRHEMSLNATLRNALQPDTTQHDATHKKNPDGDPRSDQWCDPGTLQQAADVLMTFNERAGTKFPVVGSTVCLIDIVRRLRGDEGEPVATVPELELVIDHRIALWTGTEYETSSLRPQTIFAAKFFASYLSAAQVWDERGRPRRADKDSGHRRASDFSRTPVHPSENTPEDLEPFREKGDNPF